jgi:hypothetical protein
MVWYGLDQNYNSAYTRDDSYRRTIDETIEIAERRYNIMPTAEYTLITIEGYSLYSKEIMNQPEDHLYGTTYLEIGLKNNSNNKTIKVGAISNLPRIYRRPYNGSVSESDILYLCVRSPYDENIAALIVIRPAIRGGDSDGPVTYYNIFGIDLNGLYE